MKDDKFLTINEAAAWATQFRGRKTVAHNIGYLINYAKIHAYDKNGKLKESLNGNTRVSLSELRTYYEQNNREKQWKEVLGAHINWSLSFDKITESESTKHVHRLHQYKGKFIPQLVEYFLDEHINDFKKQIFFHKGDIILDPFAGSGTTLVECLELGLHSIGIDISPFNCTISKVKTHQYDLNYASVSLRNTMKITANFSANIIGDEANDKALNKINGEYFPNPQFKFLIADLRKFQYIIEKESKFSVINNDERLENIEEAINRHDTEKKVIEKKISEFSQSRNLTLQFEITPFNVRSLSTDFTDSYSKEVLELLEKRDSSNKQSKISGTNTLEATAKVDSPFISTWFTDRQKIEMQHYLRQMALEKDTNVQALMRVVLSRTIRSCRATTHSDLATLLEPQSNPYYCTKHYKICKPVTTIIRHLKRYTEDTIARLYEFQKLRQDVFCEVIAGDSRNIDIFDFIKRRNEPFYNLLEKKKIDGIFTSPPYVGQINYHEQHAYAYELFNIERQDELEIGRQSLGTGKQAQVEYTSEISKVLINSKKFLKKEASIFIVANDSRGLYPKIADEAGLRIVDTFHRPVLNRTERDKQPYSETIFEMSF